MRTSTIAVFVLVLTSFDVRAQSPAETGSERRIALQGVVIAADSGRGLARARLDVLSGRNRVATVVADARGAFRVPAPADGPLTLRVIKAGYAAISHAVARPDASPPLRIEVPRGGVIRGRVIYTDPETVFRPLRIRRIGERPGPDSEPQPFAVDDRLEFRIGGLLPGRYVIYAMPMISGSAAVRPVAVDVTAGVEVSGVDVIFEPRHVRGEGPQTGSAIHGTVSTTAGTPIAGATVLTRGEKGPGVSSQTVTDESGQFTLRGLTPGSYAVFAAKSGFVHPEQGRGGADLRGLAVKVVGGRDVENVGLVLSRSNSVSGIVVDEFSEPVEDAAVTLLSIKRTPSGGVVAVRDTRALSQPTNDLGQFRLSRVVPGEYLVSASLPSETPDPSVPARSAYVPAYFPDARDVGNAAVVRVGSEEEIAGIAITLRRVAVARVLGVVTNSAGVPFTGTVRLTPRQTASIGPDSRTATSSATGRFAFDDVPPGDYLLRVTSWGGPTGAEFASTPITIVDRDPDPIAMRTSPGSTLSGQVVLEGGTGETLRGYSLSAVPIDSALTAGSVSTPAGPIADGEAVHVTGLAGLVRVRVWTNDERWYLRAVRVNGVDIADEPFDFGSDGRAYSDLEVVFSRAGATVRGRATDERGNPVRDYAVYLFSTDRDKWLPGSRWIRLARATADGTFSVSPLPPGEYWIAAVDRAEPGASGSAEWVDSQLFEMLAARATRALIGESQSRDITLRLIRR
jgi:carboxypeptidase family protein